MQRFLTFLILCGILGQATIRTAWTLHYQLNRAVYLEKCVNKDKPSLHCDGKCAFKKQMAAREKNENKEPRLPENFSEIKDIQLFFEAEAIPCFSIVALLESTSFPPFQTHFPEAPVSPLFRPPAV
jgi:hypothetical protein